jgi:hypothetical protein
MYDWNSFPNDLETITTSNIEENAEWLIISMADVPIPTVVYIY